MKTIVNTYRDTQAVIESTPFRWIFMRRDMFKAATKLEVLEKTIKEMYNEEIGLIKRMNALEVERDRQIAEHKQTPAMIASMERKEQIAELQRERTIATKNIKRLAKDLQLEATALEMKKVEVIDSKIQELRDMPKIELTEDDIHNSKMISHLKFGKINTRIFMDGLVEVSNSQERKLKSYLRIDHGVRFEDFLIEVDEYGADSELLKLAADVIEKNYLQPAFFSAEVISHVLDSYKVEDYTVYPNVLSI